MNAPNVVLGFLWLGITAYVLLAGADFGAGIWDLLAGRARGGMRQRERIAETIGPVWEANHVWLIFALVVTWTGFPQVFASIASTLYIPLTAAAFGIILRGSAFAFRKAVTDLRWQRLFGAAFALSSVLTPFFLGTIAGAIASQRIPLGTARGNVITCWLNPTSILGGVLAVEVCAYLAATFLTAEARRQQEADLVDAFRLRALAAGVVTGVTALAGIAVLHNDSPHLFDGLTGRALPLVVASAVFGAVSLVLMWRRRLIAVRGTAALAVVAVLWGWGVAQYPIILGPGVTVDNAAAPPQTMGALVIVLSAGVLILVPALALLYSLFQTAPSESTPHTG